MVLYLDPFSGVAGDMFIGALLDLGLDLARLHHELSKLKLSGYRLSSRRVMRGEMSGVKFDVEIDAAGPTVYRTFATIKKMIEDSALSPRVKESSLRAFTLLAQAEGRIHGLPLEQVHFHEVGAIDSIVDMVGACAGLELLDVGELWCGPLALGSGGTVKCEHGIMPVPAPATLEIVKSIPYPLRQTNIEKELTTPTGAALVAALASRFCSLPAMAVQRIGYGAGSREQQAIPNILRAVLGTVEDAAPDAAGDSSDTILEIQTNLDDASPEVLGYLAERLFAQGALDVFFTPVQMKKSRPGTLVAVMAEPHRLDAVAATLFRESGTFGLRYQPQSRLKLSRETATVATPFGEVRVKAGRWQGQLMSVHPEYEDCRARAQEKGAALRAVQDAAREAYLKSLG